MLVDFVLVKAGVTYNSLTTELATKAANKLKNRYLIKGLLAFFLRNALYAQGIKVMYTPVYDTSISEEL